MYRKNGIKSRKQKVKSSKTIEAIFSTVGKGARYYGAEVARYLGMTTSALNRSANAKEFPEIKNYL